MNKIAAGEIFNPLLQENPGTTSGVSFLSKIIQNSITLILVVGSIVFVFMLLLSGIQWIFAGSDKGAVEAAKQRLTNSIIGIIVMFSAFAIAILIERAFKVDILTIDINSLIIQ